NWVVVTGEDRGCRDLGIADSLRDTNIDDSVIVSIHVWNVSGVTRSMNFVSMDEGVSK
ncbi:hypothetical protein NPIL_321561, partial [Nephila pilipes]